jgi:hypothetical protein
MPNSVSGADGFYYGQEHLNLNESPSRAMHKLILHCASHELLKNEINMFATNPLLLPVPECTCLH